MTVQIRESENLPYSPVWNTATAAGALLCPLDVVQSVKQTLQDHELLKHGLHITSVSMFPLKRLVHVNSKAANLLNRFEDQQKLTILPEEIISLLHRQIISWKADCRVLEELEHQYESTQEEEASFRFIELFAGIGGFRVGLERIGGSCVFASEIHRCARATYERNGEGKPAFLAGNICDLSADVIPDHDILTAGFPCQSFSLLGDRQALDCENGNLFFEIVRVLRHCRPKAFLLENVVNLLRIDSGRSWHTIHSELGKPLHSANRRTSSDC